MKNLLQMIAQNLSYVSRARAACDKIIIQIPKGSRFHQRKVQFLLISEDISFESLLLQTLNMEIKFS